MDYVQEIRTSTGTFLLREDGIIESRPDKDYKGKFDLEKARETMAAMKEYCKDGPRPMVAYLEDHEITGEARKYYLENTVVSSCALIGKSFIACMMANLIINFKKPPVPVRLFPTMEKAITWLQMMEHLEEEQEMTA